MNNISEFNKVDYELKNFQKSYDNDRHLNEHVAKCNTLRVVDTVARLLQIDPDKIWSVLSNSSILNAFFQFMEIDYSVDKDSSESIQIEMPFIKLKEGANGWAQDQFILLELVLFTNLLGSSKRLSNRDRDSYNDILTNLGGDRNSRLDSAIITEINILMNAYRIYTSYCDIIKTNSGNVRDQLKNLFSRLLSTILPKSERGLMNFFCLPCGSRSHAIYLVLIMLDDQLVIRVDDSDKKQPDILTISRQQIYGNTNEVNQDGDLVNYLIDVAIHENKNTPSAINAILNKKMKHKDIEPNHDHNFVNKYTQKIRNCVYMGFILDRKIRISKGLNAKPVFDLFIKEEKNVISMVREKPELYDKIISNTVSVYSFLHGVRSGNIVVTNEQNYTANRDYEANTTLPYQRDHGKHIVKRKTELENCIDAINSGIKFLSITGLPGAGKTLLAYSLLNEVKAKFNRDTRKLIIYEFSLEDTSDEALCFQYLAFIESMQLKSLNTEDQNSLSSKNKTDLFNIIINGLQKEYNDSSIVIIYDNVDDVTQVEYLTNLVKNNFQFFSEKTLILATSQNSNVFHNVTYSCQINVSNGMTIKQSMQLLSSYNLWRILKIFVPNVTKTSGYQNIPELINVLKGINNQQDKITLYLKSSIRPQENLELQLKKISQQKGEVIDYLVENLKLVDMFEGLPLGLFIAGQYLAKYPHEKISDYLKDVEKQTERLETFFKNNIEPYYSKKNGIASQISAIIIMIEKIDKDYLRDNKQFLEILPSDIIKSLALFSNNQIPFLLVDEVINNIHDEGSGKAISNEYRRRFVNIVVDNSLCYTSEQKLSIEEEGFNRFLNMHGQAQLAGRCLLLSTNNESSKISISRTISNSLKVIYALHNKTSLNQDTQLNDLICKHFFELLGVIHGHLKSNPLNNAISDQINMLILYFIQNNYNSQLPAKLLGIVDIKHIRPLMTNLFNINISTAVILIENTICSYIESGGGAEKVSGLLNCLDWILKQTRFYERISAYLNPNEISRFKNFRIDSNITVDQTCKFIYDKPNLADLMLTVLKILSLLKNHEPNFNILYKNNFWTQRSWLYNCCLPKKLLNWYLEPLTPMQNIKYHSFKLRLPLISDSSTNIESSYRRLVDSINLLDMGSKRSLLLCNATYSCVLIYLRGQNYSLARKKLEELDRIILDNNCKILIPYTKEIEITRGVLYLLDSKFNECYCCLSQFEAVGRDLQIQYLFCVLYVIKLVNKEYRRSYPININKSCFQYILKNASIFPVGFYLLMAEYYYNEKNYIRADKMMKNYTDPQKNNDNFVPMLSFSIAYSRREFYSLHNSLESLTSEWTETIINKHNLLSKILDGKMEYKEACKYKVEYLNWLYRGTNILTAKQSQYRFKKLSNILCIDKKIDLEVGLDLLLAVENITKKDGLFYHAKLNFSIELTKKYEVQNDESSEIPTKINNIISDDFSKYINYEGEINKKILILHSILDLKKINWIVLDDSFKFIDSLTNIKIVDHNDICGCLIKFNTVLFGFISDSNFRPSSIQFSRLIVMIKKIFSFFSSNYLLEKFSPNLKSIMNLANYSDDTTSIDLAQLYYIIAKEIPYILPEQKSMRQVFFDKTVTLCKNNSTLYRASAREATDNKREIFEIILDHSSNSERLKDKLILEKLLEYHFQYQDYFYCTQPNILGNGHSLDTIDKYSIIALQSRIFREPTSREVRKAVSDAAENANRNLQRKFSIPLKLMHYIISLKTIHHVVIDNPQQFNYESLNQIKENFRCCGHSSSQFYCYYIQFISICYRLAFNEINNTEALYLELTKLLSDVTQENQKPANIFHEPIPWNEFISSISILIGIFDDKFELLKHPFIYSCKMERLLHEVKTKYNSLKNETPGLTGTVKKFLFHYTSLTTSDESQKFFKSFDQIQFNSNPNDLFLVDKAKKLSLLLTAASKNLDKASDLYKTISENKSLRITRINQNNIEMAIENAIKIYNNQFKPIQSNESGLFTEKFFWAKCSVLESRKDEFYKLMLILFNREQQLREINGAKESKLLHELKSDSLLNKIMSEEEYLLVELEQQHPSYGAETI